MWPGGAIAGDCSDVLFYEQVNYAAGVAFERATGDADAFHEAQARFVDSGAYQPDEEADLGEAFDFDDDKHMSRRLPRLAAMFLGTRR